MSGLVTSEQVPIDKRDEHTAFLPKPYTTQELLKTLHAVISQMKAGTTIPIHTHPCDEYVYVMKGVVETGGKSCSAGIFWFTPAHTQQGPHIAITDVEILTIRLGPMGVFESP
ncbi:cupin domain-containing protein [Nostoc sp. XA010]|uniref:cupin domain-containing protein n=1 Tax=Nostoc sp. XA010 TaxID=2780407 RepID=UPI001E373DDA|nr:cupin domain-containing protein [Nostoc sp. XA010]MCC5658563.1 cupin domain-containing protein [Nostoc sp. XA010]